jgi:hypothetical protein
MQMQSVVNCAPGARSKRALQSILADVGISPRGLSSAQAAAYVGLSIEQFMAEVRRGRFSNPQRYGRRKVFDRRILDADLDRLWETAA